MSIGAPKPLLVTKKTEECKQRRGGEGESRRGTPLLDASEDQPLFGKIPGRPTKDISPSLHLSFAYPSKWSDHFLRLGRGLAGIIWVGAEIPGGTIA
jgi:hypothetical protein